MTPTRTRAIPIIGFAIAGAALIAAIVALSIGQQGAKGAIEITDAGGVQQIYGGIAQEGKRLGSPVAPIAVSVFNDLQCPSCADWHLETIPPLVSDLVRSGEGVRMEFRNYAVGPLAKTVGAVAAVAAGKQGTEWQYVHLFMANLDLVPQKGVDEDFLIAVADSIPTPTFDREQWLEDRRDPASEQLVTDDGELAASLRLPAEPAVVVDGPGGTVQLEESPSVEAIEDAVDQVR